MLRPLILALAILLPLTSFAADVPLIASAAEWRYLDDGSDQGSAWREHTFDDAGWKRGPSELGYGDNDERTLVAFGPDASNKHITTYFRRSFTVADPSVFTALTIQTKRDDGAIVYLNGTEVARHNMPEGPAGHRTVATAAVNGPDELAFFATAVNPLLLVAGTNVVAVEVHQSDFASSDLSFDLRLTGTSSQDIAVVTRGPYLQMGTSTQMRIRWRTNVATDSRVRYGLAAGALTLAADDAALTTEHEVTITGLTPGTRTFYSIGSSAETLGGNDASHVFTTAPATGTPAPTRVWVIGDSGTGNTDAAAVRDAYLSFAGNATTDVWMMLGDNAYDSGTDAEYQRALFDMYPMLLRQSVVWPTLGNHETAEVPNVSGRLIYFDIFSLPTHGEAGGAASGTERYYSFDRANIHFISLDSITSDRTPTGPMLSWLREDLLATTQPWIVAFLHHPPYTKGGGGHDSDVERGSVELRRNALPILEEFGVDLVLAGHSHSYERSFLLDSHYDRSPTFISTMKRDGGSGRPGETGAYRKPTAGSAPHEGAVYAVAGSSGKVEGPAPLDHPAMFISMAELGSMVLDIEGLRLDAKFLSANGAIRDSFSIFKGRLVAPSSLRASASSATTVDLQWTDNANDEEGYRIERCAGTQCIRFAVGPNTTSYSDTTVTPRNTYTYTVRAFQGVQSGDSDAAQVTTPGTGIRRRPVRSP